MCIEPFPAAQARNDAGGDGGLGKRFVFGGVADQIDIAADRQVAGVDEGDRLDLRLDRPDQGQVGDQVPAGDGRVWKFGAVGEDDAHFGIGPDDMGVGEQIGVLDQDGAAGSQGRFDKGDRGRDVGEDLSGAAGFSRWSAAAGSRVG